MTSARRLDELERNQTSIAKKVLAAVPIAEPWTVGEIMSELGRQGPKPAHHIVMGCLQSLGEDGLVREQSGKYIKVRPKLVQVQSVIEEKPQKPDIGTDPMSKLAELASGLRKLESDIAAFAKKTDDVALEIEEEMQKTRDETSNLRKLKELLKSLD